MPPTATEALKLAGVVPIVSRTDAADLASCCGARRRDGTHGEQRAVRRAAEDDRRRPLGVREGSPDPARPAARSSGVAWASLVAGGVARRPCGPERRPPAHLLRAARSWSGPELGASDSARAFVGPVGLALLEVAAASVLAPTYARAVRAERRVEAEFGRGRALAGRGPRTAANPVIGLQRTIGNRAVSLLLQREDAATFTPAQTLKEVEARHAAVSAAAKAAVAEAWKRKARHEVGGIIYHSGRSTGRPGHAPPVTGWRSTWASAW